MNFFFFLIRRKVCLYYLWNWSLANSFQEAHKKGPNWRQRNELSEIHNSHYHTHFIFNIIIRDIYYLMIPTPRTVQWKIWGKRPRLCFFFLKHQLHTRKKYCPYLLIFPKKPGWMWLRWAWVLVCPPPVTWPIQYDLSEDSVCVSHLTYLNVSLLLGMIFKHVQQYRSTGQSEWDGMPAISQPSLPRVHFLAIHPTEAVPKVLMIIRAPSQEFAFLTGCLKRQFMNV